MGIDKELKTREYYMARLGMAGEIPSLRAPRLGPFNPDAAGRELKRMEEDGLIYYHRLKSGKRMIRISDPLGYEAIRSLSPALHLHSEILNGENGRRYYGSQRRREKKARESEIISMMTSLGYYVDGFRLDENKCIEKTDNFDTRDIISSVEGSSTQFITGAVIRKINDDYEHPKIKSSIEAGTLISPGGIYSTFAAMSASPSFRQTSELSVYIGIKNLCEELQGRTKSSDRRLRGIFYLSKPSLYPEMLRREAADYNLSPTKTFKFTYAVPIKENAEDVTRLLTIKDWHDKTNLLLGLSKDETADGKADDGRSVYNLLCGNVGRTEEIRTRIERDEAYLIVHDWQKDAIEEAYEREITALVLDDTQFKAIVDLAGKMT